MHAFHLLLRGCQRFRVHVLGGTRSDAAPLHTRARQIRAARRRRLFDQDEATDSREVDGGVLGQGGGPGRPVTGHLPSGAPQRAGRNPAVAPSVHRKRTSTKQQQKQQQKQQPAPADAADSPAGEGSGDVRPVAGGADEAAPQMGRARRRVLSHSSGGYGFGSSQRGQGSSSGRSGVGFPPGIRYREMLRAYGKVVEIRAYANYHTLNYVPEIWEEAMTRGMEVGMGLRWQQGRRCRVRCQVANEDKLRSHFRQLHQREHAKKLAHRPSAEKYSKSDKFARYQSAAHKVLAPKRGYDLAGILRRLGVTVWAVPMGKQKADVVLQREAVELLERERGKRADKEVGGKKEARKEEAEGPLEAEKPPSVFVLMSDDHGFEMLLKLFAMAGWRALVVSNTPFKNAEQRLAWSNVAAPEEYQYR
ncbi:hypothetical protein PLESTB_000778700 [Pleodorina starrii]|uniref:NYN domain-containing protein n=1 Tax=Pleodorina starrii TaxID=330485 RepID=A0A9W6BKT5_9CHLO|nr:hypothetical protein PLESTB_000778700 [Pleodorina starrii]